MGENDGQDGEFIYEARLCAPPCPLCGFVDRRLTGEWCSHYIGMVIDNSLSEGPFADEFASLWEQAQQELASADGATLQQIEKTTSPAVLQALDEWSLDWLLTAFPNAVSLQEYEHMASSDGFVLYDSEPFRFEAVLTQLRDLVTAARDLNTKGSAG